MTEGKDDEPIDRSEMAEGLEFMIKMNQTLRHPSEALERASDTLRALLAEEQDYHKLLRYYMSMSLEFDNYVLENRIKPSPDRKLPRSWRG
mgnify:CR=1 FL=1